MGGIVCATTGPNLKGLYAFSITRLTIDPAHPLAAEVQAYQKRRIRGLKLPERARAIAELMDLSQPTQKVRGKKGFGR